MNDARHRTSPIRLVAMVLAAGLLWSLFFDDAGEAGPGGGLPAIPTPLVTIAACEEHAEGVGVRARELERRAEAAFERAPFDQAEIARAVRDMGEAVQCYERAHDRINRNRGEARLIMFERALDVRVHRATLGLTLASRHGDASALQRHTRALLALTSESGARGRAYREALSRVLGKARDAQNVDPSHRGS